MQQTADPTGQLLSTRTFAGIEGGLNTYDIIRRNQKLQRREETKRARLAEVGGAATPLAQARGLTEVGFETGEPSLITAGLTAQERFTPEPAQERVVSPGQGIYDPTTGRVTTPLPRTEGLRTVSPGEGIYDPTTGGVTVPVERPPALRTLSPGQGVYDPATGRTDVPIPARPEAFTLGVGARRYQATPEGGVELVAEGRPPAPPTGRETDAQMQQLNRINKVESVVSDNIRTIPRPSVSVYDSSGYLVANPNYQQQMEEYNRRVEGIRQQIYDRLGVENPMQYTPTLNVPDTTRLPRAGAGRQQPGPPATGRGARPSFKEFSEGMRGANPGVELSDKELREEYRDTFGGR
jgi:hypothetical protein